VRVTGYLVRLLKADPGIDRSTRHPRLAGVRTHLPAILIMDAVSGSLSRR